VWLMTIGLALGALGLVLYASRGWRDARQTDLGSMSQRWLGDHRAGSR